MSLAPILLLAVVVCGFHIGVTLMWPYVRSLIRYLYCLVKNVYNRHWNMRAKMIETDRDLREIFCGDLELALAIARLNMAQVGAWSLMAISRFRSDTRRVQAIYHDRILNLYSMDRPCYFWPPSEQERMLMVVRRFVPMYYNLLPTSAVVPPHDRYLGNLYQKIGDQLSKLAIFTTQANNDSRKPAAFDFVMFNLNDAILEFKSRMEAIGFGGVEDIAFLHVVQSSLANYRTVWCAD